jgi:formate/nitrite transporter FocA (FNT family)
MASPPFRMNIMTFKVPADIAKAAIAAGCTKCNITWQKLLVLGFLAGAYIAFGALLSEIVAGGLSNGTITTVTAQYGRSPFQQALLSSRQVPSSQLASCWS